MKAKKILIGLLIIAALVVIVANAGLMGSMFGPLGEVVAAGAVAVLAALFILVVVLPLLGFIFAGMSLIILLILLALAMSLPFAVMHGHRPGTSLFESSDLRSVAPFDRVNVSGDLNVLVVSGGGHAVALKGNMDDLTAVQTMVRDRQLIIRDSGGPGPHNEVRVAVSMQDLKGFHMEGAGHASLQRIEADSFDLDMAGAAQVEAAGRCHKAVIHLSGAGSLNARNLQCDEVDVTVDGAGSARVFAAQHLNVKITGLGQVTYAGNPKKIDRNISGLGRMSAE